MKVLAVLVALMLATPAFAATLLSDSEMGEMYAGQYLTINDVSASGSAVAAQSNIGAIAGGGDLYQDTITNINDAGVLNYDGCSAVALQNNIGLAASLGGNLDSVDIDNWNETVVDNLWSDGGDVSGSSLEADECIGINVIYASGSAVALQSNIGAIYSDGYAINSTIDNYNWASVYNGPDY